MIEQSRLDQFWISLRDFKYIFFLFALSLISLTIGQYQNNITFVLLGFIFIALALGLLYFKFPKLVLGEIASIILIFSIYLSIIVHDSNILVGGATITLVLVTSWYAGIVYKQLEIIRREKESKFIAEIARSVFSAMQCDIKKIQKALVNGNFLLALNPLTLSIDRTSPNSPNYPNHYLNEDIYIQREHAKAEGHDLQLEERYGLSASTLFTKYSRLNLKMEVSAIDSTAK